MMLKINKKLMTEMIKLKYVSKTRHSYLPYSIYNYTRTAQFDNIWNEITINCRGLILDDDFNIIAKPFKKFFNFENYTESDIPNEEFDVYEKMDGSLGILYFDNKKKTYKKEAFLATRGSFESEQAKYGTKILQENYSTKILKRDRTYLFEIIYPENRIVIDYKGMKDLILLAVIETKTEKEFDIYNLEETKQFKLVKKYNNLNDIYKLKEKEDNKREGYIVKFKSNFRIKIKFEEYKRLHRIVTNISNKIIWEHLKNNKNFNEILERVPNEFKNWVNTIKNNLTKKYKEIENKNINDFKNLSNRKETAQYFKTCKYQHILFQMLDKKDYSKTIWKILKPKYQLPFKNIQGTE